MMTYTLPSGSKSICNQEEKKIKKPNSEWLPKLLQETRSFQTSQSQGVGKTHSLPIEPPFAKRHWGPCTLTGIKNKCAHLESLSPVNFTFQIFNVLSRHIFAPLLSRKSESATIEQLFNCNLYWAQIWKCGNQHCDSKTDQLWSEIGGKWAHRAPTAG